MVTHQRTGGRDCSARGCVRELQTTTLALDICHEDVQRAFRGELKDNYYAEKGYRPGAADDGKEGYPKEAAGCFTRHEKKTGRQVDRLDQVFELIGKRVRGKDCPAVDGIIEEAEEVMLRKRTQEGERPCRKAGGRR